MHAKLSAVFAAAILGAASLSAVAQPSPTGPGQLRESLITGEPYPAAQRHDGQRPQAAPQGQQGKPAHVTPPQKGPGKLHGDASQRHGAGPDHQWTKGSRVPPQYRGHHYVVNNWQRHGLHKPGRGQQWVQNGNDYLFVAVASGVIAQIVFGH